MGTAFIIRQAKLDFTVQSTRTEQRRVQGIRPECQLAPVRSGVGSPVGSHDDFDISARVKSVQLVNELQHGSLNLVITALSIVESGTTNRVDFVEKDDASLL